MFSVFFPQVLLEGPGTGKLVSVDKYATEMSINSGKSEKKGIPQKYYLKGYFPKTFHRDEPFHLNYLRSFRESRTSGVGPDQRFHSGQMSAHA